MSRLRSWKSVAAPGLAAITLFASVGALAALGGLGGPFMWSRTVGFAESHDKRAHAILDRSTAPAALTQATAEVGRALALSPYSNAARLRLAYIDTVRNGRLGPVGRARLAQSYDLMPYDYSVAAWRVRFALEHWRSLTPELRGRVHAEALAFGRGGIHDVDMRGALQSIRDPAGRLAAALWLRELSR